MDLTRVLVTGGTGFLGTEIVKALLDTKAYQVTVVDINPPALGTSAFKSVRYVRANILQPNELHKVFTEAMPAIVVHTVGVYPLGDARYNGKGKEMVFKINIEGTRNVINAAKDCGAKGFVHTSSVTVLLDELDKGFKNVDENWSIGRAQTSYGQSKAIAEELVLSANTSDFATCALRLSVLFGPNDPACIPIMHACIRRGETPFIIGTGTNLQDFTYVSNAADAHVLAVRNLLNSGTAAGQALFITNGEPVSPRVFCLAVWKEFGHTPKFEMRIPEGLGWWLGFATEWASWIASAQATFSRGMVAEVSKDRYVSISKARMVLGYVPKVKLPEALRITCQHFQQQMLDRSKR